MNLGEILDRAFQIYRSRFLVFAGIAALPALAVAVEYIAANTWLLHHQIHGQNLLFQMSLHGLLQTLLLYAATAFLHVLARPAYVRAVASTVSDMPCSLRHALDATLQRWRTILALDLFEQLVVLLAPASIFIACVVITGMAVDSSQVDNAAVAGAFLLFFTITAALVIYFLWIGACYSLSFAAAVLEGISWFDAIKRSWKLSKKSRGRVILTWSGVCVGSFVCSFVMRWTLYFVLFFTVGSRGIWHGFPLYSVYYSLASAVISTLLGPIYPIAITLFYYDQRIRLEGYDIERMMDAAGMNAPELSPTEDSPIASAAPEEVQP
jgi:hypothetical protein